MTQCSMHIGDNTDKMTQCTVELILTYCIRVYCDSGRWDSCWVSRWVGWGDLIRLHSSFSTLLDTGDDHLTYEQRNWGGNIIQFNLFTSWLKPLMSDCKIKKMILLWFYNCLSPNQNFYPYILILNQHGMGDIKFMCHFNPLFPLQTQTLMPR